MFKIKDRVEFIPGIQYPDYDATADIEVINNNIKELEKNAKEQDTQIKSKEPAFPKNSGWNLEKTDSPENNSNKLFTAKGALNLLNNLTTKISEGINSAKTTLRSEMLNIKNSLTTLINGKLNHGGYSGTGQDLKNAIDGKQNATDSALKTLSKKVVGAINENKLNIDNKLDKKHTNIITIDNIKQLNLKNENFSTTDLGANIRLILDKFIGIFGRNASFCIRITLWSGTSNLLASVPDGVNLLIIDGNYDRVSFRLVNCDYSDHQYVGGLRGGNRELSMFRLSVDGLMGLKVLRNGSPVTSIQVERPQIGDTYEFITNVGNWRVCYITWTGGYGGVTVQAGYNEVDWVTLNNDGRVVTGVGNPVGIIKKWRA